MDSILRFSIFAIVFAGVATLEVFWPRRKQILTRRDRWPGNIGLTILNVLLMRFILPLSLTGFADMANQNGLGILSQITMPLTIQIFLSIVLLDLVIYAQHVVFHQIPFLWRLHRVHHADTEIDITTALRFHPIEILISMAIKFTAVAAIGTPAEAVLLFEIILNACAMFNHGNLRLPNNVDSILRHFLVTPDMHRVHHSVIVAETNSNYGFNIPLWDWLFGTYCAQPKHGHTDMTIGLNQFRNPREENLIRLLTQPFRKSPEARI